MIDRTRNFTADEVRTLAQAFPELVAETTPGFLVPTLSREEFLHLGTLYPSMLKDAQPAPRSTGNVEEDALHACYPSMFKE